MAVEADTLVVASGREPGPTSLVWRSPDVLLVLIAFLPAVALGAQELGYVLGGGGWILQRMVAVLDRCWVNKADDPVRRLAINLFEAFGRIWLLAGVIIIAAVAGERQDGLTAAVVIFAAYSVDFILRIASRPRRTGAVT